MLPKNCITVTLILILLVGCGRSTAVPASITSPTSSPSPILKGFPPTATILAPPLAQSLLSSQPTPTITPPLPVPFPRVTATVDASQAAQIEWRYPGTVGTVITGLSFINMRQGWVVLDGSYFFQTRDGGATWTELPRLDPGLSNIQFINSTTGWARAEDRLYKTSDGGKSWKQVSDSFPESGSGYFYFVNERDVYRVLDNVLQRSGDGGKTWKVLHPEAVLPKGGLPFQLSGMSFINASQGWFLYMACVAPSCRMALLKTVNGGESFEMVQDMGQSMRPGGNIFFLDDQTGWISGWQSGLFLQTSDGGNTWTIPKAEPSGNYPSVSNMHMFSKDEGVASGVDFASGFRGVMATHDGGLSWEPLFPALLPAGPVYFLDTNTGYGVGGFADPQMLLKTENGGKSWKKVGELPDRVLQLQFLSSQVVWAGVTENLPGKAGDLWQSTDSGKTWELRSIPPVFRMRSFFFLDESSGVAWDNQNNLVYTLDGGNTWQPLKTDAFTLPLSAQKCGWAVIPTQVYHACPGDSAWHSVFSLHDVHQLIPVSENAAWVLGVPAGVSGAWHLFKTADGGKTWQQAKIGGMSFRNLSFINLEQGWASGYGFLLTTMDGGATWQQMPPVLISTR